MKTNKFEYLVSVYKDENYEHCDGEYECITLAEARLEAMRHNFASITCIGEIKYSKGKEID